MGTKRITIKEFRAMGDEEARMFWHGGNWPFDPTNTCGTCLTSHAKQFGKNYCALRAHGKIAREVGVVGIPIGAWLKENAAKLFALRKKFDALYRAASPSEVRK